MKKYSIKIATVLDRAHYAAVVEADNPEAAEKLILQPDAYAWEALGVAHKVMLTHVVSIDIAPTDPTARPAKKWGEW